MPGQQIRSDITRTQPPIVNKLVPSHNGIGSLNVVWRRGAIYGVARFRCDDYANSARTSPPRNPKIIQASHSSESPFEMADPLRLVRVSAYRDLISNSRDVFR